MSGYIKELRKLIGAHPIIMAGACVILMDGNGRLLLQQRTDNGLWGLPGGSMEPLVQAIQFQKHCILKYKPNYELFIGKASMLPPRTIYI